MSLAWSQTDTLLSLGALSLDAISSSICNEQTCLQERISFCQMAQHLGQCQPDVDDHAHNGAEVVRA